MKRISVFAPMGTLDHQTGILNAIRCFAAAGYQVDVLAVRNVCYPQPTFDGGVRVLYLPWTFASEREPRTIVTLLFVAWVLGTFWRSHAAIFAGGIRGLVAAYAYSLFRKARIVNYQTELYVGLKLDTPAAKLFKFIERRAIRRSDFSIEHTHERAQLLAQDAKIPADRVLIVPNAPFGPARRVDSAFLHDRLRVQKNISLLLYAGTFGEAFETTALVRAAQSLPADWRCVLHSVQNLSDNDPYVTRLRELDSRSRVLFSLESVPYARVDEVMASARIGIALYSANLGENYSTVGLASGKLTHFLKVGVPVIVSALPGLADFVREHEVGDVLHEMDALGEVVARIAAHIDGYRERALRCFNEHLAYERCFATVLARIDKWPGAEV